MSQWSSALQIFDALGNEGPTSGSPRIAKPRIAGSEGKGEHFPHSELARERWMWCSRGTDLPHRR
jgi:hypothetical protein